MIHCWFGILAGVLLKPFSQRLITLISFYCSSIYLVVMLHANGVGHH